MPIWSDTVCCLIGEKQRCKSDVLDMFDQILPFRNLMENSHGCRIRQQERLIVERSLREVWEGNSVEASTYLPGLHTALNR